MSRLKVVEPAAPVKVNKFERKYKSAKNKLRECVLDRDDDALEAFLTGTMGTPVLDPTAAIEDDEPLVVLVAKVGTKLALRMLLDLPTTDINAVDKHGRTALSYAAMAGNGNTMYELLTVAKPAANPNVCDVSSQSPLMHAVKRSQRDSISYLLKAKANPNTRQIDGFTALRIAVFHSALGIAETLLDAKADPNVGDNRFVTPLACAVVQGDSACVALLLRYGASPNRCNTVDRTPLMTAALYGWQAIVVMLLEGGAKHHRTRQGESALIIAAKENHWECVNTLLDASASVDVLGGPTKRNLIMMAAESNCPTVLHRAAGLGCPINGVDEDGDTALTLATMASNQECVTVLLQLGAVVNHKNDENRSALMIAVCLGADNIVMQLLKASADPLCIHPDGRSSIHAAAAEGRSNIVSMLLSAGAGADHCDADGRSMLVMSVLGGHVDVLTTLLDAGAGASVKYCMWGDFSLLMLAVQLGDADIARAVLTYADVDIDLKDKTGRTALMLAAEMGMCEIVNEIIAKGAALNLQDNDGLTALRLAARAGYCPVVATLVQSGADTRLKDPESRSELLMAAFDGRTPAVLGALDNPKEASEWLDGRAREDFLKGTTSVDPVTCLTETLEQQQLHNSDNHSSQ